MVLDPMQPARSTSALGYVPAFDGLRGIAVLAVVFFHAKWIVGGWAGVDVFFVLSGYLITTNLRREADRTGGIRLGAFYMRRILRLTPALWAVLAVVAALAPFRGHPDNTWHAVALGLTYTTNWARAFALFPDDLLDHTWSLAMEEQFYLVWPLAFILIRGRRPLAFLLAAFVLVVCWRLTLVFGGAHYERTYNGFDTHSDGMILGCMLALATLPGWLVAAARKFAVMPIVGLAAVFAGLPIATPSAQAAGLSVTALLAAWLIVAIRGDGRLAGILSARPLVALGQISYGLYLWHFPVFILLYSKVPGWMVPGLIGLSAVLAVLSYRFIEKPFLRLKTGFEPAARPPRPAPLPAKVA